MSPSPADRWDPPAHLSISEREYLENAAQNILLIQEGAALSIGKQLLEIKRRFQRDPQLGKWFTRWVKEKTCLTLNQATVWLRLAEESESNDSVRKLLEDGASEDVLYRTALLPKEYKEAILESLLKGIEISRQEVEDLKESPFVKLDKMEEIVYQLHAELADVTRRQVNQTGDKRSLSAKKRGIEGRLEKALAELAVAKAEAKQAKADGDSKAETISFLRREVRNERLRNEQLTADPDSENERMCAKALVDMTQSTEALMKAFALFEAIKDNMTPKQRREVYHLIDHTYDRFKDTAER